MIQSAFTRSLRKLVVVLLGLTCVSAYAGNIAVISNRYYDEVAADFAARYTAHTFTGFSAEAPLALGDLDSFDAVLLFEDGLFDEAPLVGDVVAAFANTGRAVVLATFYNQDRSDTPVFTPSGWGALEELDPNTSDTIGTSYDGDTLDAGSVVPHALTTGVSELWSGPDTGYSGGNQAKPGSTVLAYWSNPNFLGNPDPAIAFRVTGNACVTHIGIIPHYEIYETFDVGFGGDYYQLWGNAMDWAAAGCAGETYMPVPALDGWALLALLMGLSLTGVYVLRRIA